MLSFVGRKQKSTVHLAPDLWLQMALTRGKPERRESEADPGALWPYTPLHHPGLRAQGSKSAVPLPALLSSPDLQGAPLL